MLTSAQQSRFHEQIDHYAQSQSLTLSSQQIDAILQYLNLFIKWNKTYNLSAIREPNDMFTKHILDSLSVAAHINGKRFIDVGTGGGLPGLVLAICFPDREFVLLDSAGKKTRFLENVKRELKLSNVEVQNLRVESFTPEARFDGVISRAFASLHDMLHWCQHLVNDNGVFYAMKGVEPQDELKQLDKKYQLHGIKTLTVPNLDANRCLVELSLAQCHNESA